MEIRVVLLGRVWGGIGDVCRFEGVMIVSRG